jgi:hypothetical protein
MDEIREDIFTWQHTPTTDVQSSLIAMFMIANERYRCLHSMKKEKKGKGVLCYTGYLQQQKEEIDLSTYVETRVCHRNSFHPRIVEVPGHIVNRCSVQF